MTELLFSNLIIILIMMAAWSEPINTQSTIFSDGLMMIVVNLLSFVGNSKILMINDHQEDSGSMLLMSTVS